MIDKVTGDPEGSSMGVTEHAIASLSKSLGLKLHINAAVVEIH